jgi:hypothetical protein
LKSKQTNKQTGLKLVNSVGALQRQNKPSHNDISTTHFTCKILGKTALCKEEIIAKKKKNHKLYKESYYQKKKPEYIIAGKLMSMEI